MVFSLRILLAPALAALCLGLSACKSFNDRADTIVAAYQVHDMARATTKVNDMVKEYSSGRDALLWRLEQGSVLRGAGDYQGSIAAFDEADRMASEYDEKAKVSIGTEAAAALTNLTMFPYEGHDADRIMMNTYKALDYLQLGNPDAARVELRRAYERQSEAVTRNAKRIEKARQEADAKKDEYDASRTQEDPGFRQALDTNYAKVNGMAVYGNYVNPFAEFLSAVYSLYYAVDASDREKAVTSFRRLTQMLPAQSYLKADLAQAEAVAQGGELKDLTYVIVEGGLGPHREQIRIDLPIFLIGGQVDYVGAAFPRLEFNDNYPGALAVTVGSQTLQSEQLASIDAIVAEEFKNDLPAIITRTLVASGIKAAAAYAANRATKDNQIANILTRITATVYQIVMNEADLRTWRTLPKEFQYCRFETPADRRITVRLLGNPQPREVVLAPGKLNVVLVRAASAQAPAMISQFAH